MGAGQSQDCTTDTDPSKCKTEYRVTHSDVIRVQSILLDVHQSLRELQRKQDELKSLVSTQNRLFNQQNEIITKFEQVIDDFSKSSIQDQYQGQEIPEDSYAVSNNNNNNNNNNNSPADAPICNFKSGSGGGDHENHENVNYSENKWDSDSFYPVHTLGLGLGLGEFERTEKDEDDDFNEDQENSGIRIRASAKAGSGEGIRRLLILDVTVILARLTSGNIGESAHNLESLLLKGPVLNFNQFEIIAQTVLEKTIVETGRAGIFARLVQKVNVKLSAEHQEQWRHALVKTYQRKLHEKYSYLQDQDQDQSRGVIYLISELFRNHVIAPQDVIDVGDELLAKIVNNQDEIATMNFHILLLKVGKSLEAILHQIKSEGSYKVGLSGNIIITPTPQELPNVNWLDATFDSIRSIVTENTNSPNLLLLGLLELRENNWESAQD